MSYFVTSNTIVLRNDNDVFFDLGCFGPGQQFNARLVPSLYYLVSAAISI